MANPETQVNLDALHAAIVSAIHGAFPIFKTVEDHRQDTARVQVPACLIEMSEAEAFDDPGTGQIALTLRYEARILVGFRDQEGKKAKRIIRSLAVELAHLVRLNRWGLPVGPAEVIGCMPDAFAPECDQYEVWRVEWTQVAHIGKSVWSPAEGDPPTPTTVLAGEQGDPPQPINP